MISHILYNLENKNIQYLTFVNNEIIYKNYTHVVEKLFLLQKDQKDTNKL